MVNFQQVNMDGGDLGRGNTLTKPELKTAFSVIAEIFQGLPNPDSGFAWKYAIELVPSNFYNRLQAQQYVTSLAASFPPNVTLYEVEGKTLFDVRINGALAGYIVYIIRNIVP